jgi:hypothetical protein
MSTVAVKMPQTPMSRHHFGALPDISILEMDRERRERREANQMDFRKVNIAKRPLQSRGSSRVQFDESFLQTSAHAATAGNKRQCIGLSLPLSMSSSSSMAGQSEEPSSPPSLISCMSPDTSSFSDDDDSSLGDFDLQTPYLQDLDPTLRRTSTTNNRRHFGVPHPTLKPRKAFTDQMDTMYLTAQKSDLPFMPL